MSHIIQLDTLDLDQVDAQSNLYLAILARVEKVLTDHFYNVDQDILGEVTASLYMSEGFAALRALQSDICRSIFATVYRRAPNQDCEEFYHDLVITERIHVDMYTRFGPTLDLIAKRTRWRDYANPDFSLVVIGRKRRADFEYLWRRIACARLRVDLR